MFVETTTKTLTAIITLLMKEKQNKQTQKNDIYSSVYLSLLKTLKWRKRTQQDAGYGSKKLASFARPI